jgi:hypothetical protein
MTYEQAECLLTFERLYSASTLQTFFAKLFMGEWEEAATKYTCGYALSKDKAGNMVPDWPKTEYFATYVRYLTEKLGFGGMFTVKTAEEILFTGYDSFLATSKA